jgi:endonuclease YncB( thermonuclease family)
MDVPPGQTPAMRYLQQRLPIGREVSLDVKTTDRYGRTVAAATAAARSAPRPRPCCVRGTPTSIAMAMVRPAKA